VIQTGASAVEQLSKLTGFKHEKAAYAAQLAAYENLPSVRMDKQQSVTRESSPAPSPSADRR
jgi:hypothetical protein